MIELDDTDVAHVTVTAARRSKSEARLTEFELEENGWVRLVHLQVVHTSLSWHIIVFIWEVAFHVVPAAGRYNARVSRGSVQHEEVGGKQEVPEEANEHFPCHWAIKVEL